MNAIQSLKTRVSRRFPMAVLSIDEPKQLKGIWFLDIRLDDKIIVVQWQAYRGYAISDLSSRDAVPFDDLPDRICIDGDEALRAIIILLGGNP